MTQMLNAFWSISVRNLRFLQTQQFCCQQLMKCSDKVHETGRANESVYFLKMQREQLKKLRSKILKERDLIKERVKELDQQIENIKKKNIERGNKNSPNN